MPSGTNPHPRHFMSFHSQDTHTRLLLHDLNGPNDAQALNRNGVSTTLAPIHLSHNRLSRRSVECPVVRKPRQNLEKHRQRGQSNNGALAVWICSSSLSVLYDASFQPPPLTQ